MATNKRVREKKRKRKALRDFLLAYQVTSAMTAACNGGLIGGLYGESVIMKAYRAYWALAKMGEIYREHLLLYARSVRGDEQANPPQEAGPVPGPVAAWHTD